MFLAYAEVRSRISDKRKLSSDIREINHPKRFSFANSTERHLLLRVALFFWQCIIMMPSHERIESGDTVMSPLLARTDILYYLFCKNVDEVLWVVINNASDVCSVCRVASTCRTAKHAFDCIDTWSRSFRKSGYKSVRALHACTALFFQNRFMGALDFKFIHSCLRPNPSLVTLYLNHNDLRDEGCACITGSNVLHTLRHLSVSHNKITDVGAALLLACCTGGTLNRVRELNVSNNLLSPDLCASFREMHHPNRMFLSV